MKTITQGAEKAPLIDKAIISKYYEAVRASTFGEYGAMEAFALCYPKEYKRFSAVHRKRARIKTCIEAMKAISTEVYFGTLTFNGAKDENKRATKRKEAFKFLNRFFQYVLLVEEFGETKGRYHIHFVGTFKEGTTFQSFTHAWHSRQNLRELKGTENVSQYLCKYISKELPRVRCNKPLIALEKAYKLGLSMERDKFYTLGVVYQLRKGGFLKSHIEVVSLIEGIENH